MVRRRATIVVEWTSGERDTDVQRMVQRHADEIMTNLITRGWVAEPSVSGALSEVVEDDEIVGEDP